MRSEARKAKNEAREALRRVGAEAGWRAPSRLTRLRASILLGLFAFSCEVTPIRVGSKNFTESVILGELIAQKLESAGCHVDRKLDMGGTFVCDTAIRNGAIDAYPEYSGTALSAILKQPNGDVAAEYAKRKLHWGPALGFNNTFAMIVRGDDPRLRKISDLRLAQNELQPGFGYEFVERADGWNGLLRAYGLQFAKPPKTMDLGLTYKALIGKEIDLIAGDSTNGLNESLKLKVLLDDKHYFPRYDAAVVRRDDIDRKCGGASKALESLRNTIDDATMRRLNFEADGKKRPIPEIVREYLRHVTPSVSEGSGRLGGARMASLAPTPAQIPRSRSE